MYGKLNERKLRENDYILSCEQAREELNDYINEEARRVNVDSAKKRAVVQHMDYQGFRQMVLGANIFPTKSKQLYNFSKGQTSNIPIIASEQPTDLETKKEKPQHRKQQQIILQRIVGKSELHCNSFREFKKKFNEHYTPELTNLNLESIQCCYNLIKEQNQERIRKIFSSQCEGNLLVKICRVFDCVVGEMGKKNVEAVEGQALFMVMFFRTISSIPTMKPITLAILSKKQKQTIVDTISKLQQLIARNEKEKDETYKQDIEAIQSYFSVNVNVNAQK